MPNTTEFEKLQRAWQRRLKHAEDSKNDYSRVRVVVKTANNQFFDAYRVQLARQLRRRQPPYFVLLGMLYRPDLKTALQQQPQDDQREITIVGYESNDQFIALAQPFSRVPIKHGAICRPIDNDVVPAPLRARLAISCSCKDFEYCAAPHGVQTLKQRAIRNGAIYGCKHMMMVNMYELNTDAVPPDLPNPFKNPALQDG